MDMSIAKDVIRVIRAEGDRRSVQLQSAANRPVFVSTAIAVTVTVVVNAMLLSLAALDRSFLAFGIMIVIGPITNGVLALLSLPLIPVVRRVSGGESITPYVVAGVLTPSSAILIDAICIMSMHLHGC
jgi:hypothetical protein